MAVRKPLVLFCFLFVSIAPARAIQNCEILFGRSSNPSALRPIVVIERGKGRYQILHRTKNGIEQSLAKSDAELQQMLAILRRANASELVAEGSPARATEEGETFAKYLSKPAPARNSPSFKAHLADPRNWKSERQKLHQEVIEAQMQRTRDLSKALQSSDLARESEGKPLLILTRGNTASGKSTTLKNAQSPVLKKLGAKDYSETLGSGTLNPDRIKSQLQAFDMGATSSQVHEEGSSLTDRLIENAFKERLSFVVDKRFGSLQSVESVAKAAKERGYEVVLIDVDTDLSSSGLRLLNRKPGGPDPNVPFDAVKKGFEEARAQRNAIAQSPYVDWYELVSTSETKPRLVASRSHSPQLKIGDAKTWQNATQIAPDQVESAQKSLAHVVDTLNNVSPEDYQIADQVLESLPQLPTKVPRNDSALELFAAQEQRNQAPVLIVRQKELRPEDLMVSDLDSTDPEKIYSQVDVQQYGILMRLKDGLYEVRKGGGMQDHGLLARALREYFESSFMNARVELRERGQGIEVFIDGLNEAEKHRVLSDSQWKPTLDSAGRIVISTQEVGRIPWDRLVENEFVHPPGLGAPSIEAPYVHPAQALHRRANSLRYYDEVMSGSASHVKEPLLMDLRTTARKFRLEFGRELEDVAFRFGFRSDEASNYLVGAQATLDKAGEFWALSRATPSAVHFASQTRRLAEAAQESAKIAHAVALHSENMVKGVLEGGVKLEKVAELQPTQSNLKSSLMGFLKIDRFTGKGLPSVPPTDFDYVVRGGPYFELRLNSHQMSQRYGADWKSHVDDELRKALSEFHGEARKAQDAQKQAQRLVAEIDRAKAGDLFRAKSYSDGGFAKKPSSAKRVAFFPGTYDPPHEGHLKAARTVANELGFDEVVLVPNPVPDHKPGSTPTLSRNKMVMERVFNEPGMNALFFAANDSQVPTSNRALLEKMRSLYPGAELTQIIGDDVYAKLLAQGKLRTDGSVRYVVMNRGADSASVPKPPEELKKYISFVSAPEGNGLSSSALRKRIAAGEEVSPDDLHPSVRRVIEEQKLYR